MCMTGEYPWKIIMMSVEIYRGSKAFKMKDVQGYPRVPKTVHF